MLFYLSRRPKDQLHMLICSYSQQDGGSWSPEKRSSLPRHASILGRHGYHDHEESSTSITSSGSTAPRRPTCKLQLKYLCLFPKKAFVTKYYVFFIVLCISFMSYVKLLCIKIFYFISSFFLDFVYLCFIYKVPLAKIHVNAF